MAHRHSQAQQQSDPVEQPVSAGLKVASPKLKVISQRRPPTPPPPPQRQPPTPTPTPAPFLMASSFTTQLASTVAPMPIVPWDVVDSDRGVCDPAAPSQSAVFHIPLQQFPISEAEPETCPPVVMSCCSQAISTPSWSADRFCRSTASSTPGTTAASTFYGISHVKCRACSGGRRSWRGGAKTSRRWQSWCLWWLSSRCGLAAFSGAGTPCGTS